MLLIPLFHFLSVSTPQTEEMEFFHIRPGGSYIDDSFFDKGGVVMLWGKTRKIFYTKTCIVAMIFFI